MNELMITVGASALLFAALPAALDAWDRYRNTHDVSCPDRHTQARVRIDPIQSALIAIVGTPGDAIVACSEWPCCADCTRACSRQLGTATGS